MILFIWLLLSDACIKHLRRYRYIECSIETGTGVQAVWEDIVRAIRLYRHYALIKQPSHGIVLCISNVSF
jgi:hypothetical protein